MCSAATFALDAGSGILDANQKVAGKVTFLSMAARYSEKLSHGSGGFMMPVPGKGNRIVGGSAGSQLTTMHMQSIAVQSATEATVTASRGVSDIVPGAVSALAGKAIEQ